MSSMYKKEFHLIGNIEEKENGNVVVATACGLAMAKFCPCHREINEVIEAKNPEYVTCDSCKKTKEFKNLIH